MVAWLGGWMGWRVWWVACGWKRAEGGGDRRGECRGTGVPVYVLAVVCVFIFVCGVLAVVSREGGGGGPWGGLGWWLREQARFMGGV